MVFTENDIDSNLRKPSRYVINHNDYDNDGNDYNKHYNGNRNDNDYNNNADNDWYSRRRASTQI